MDRESDIDKLRRRVDETIRQRVDETRAGLERVEGQLSFHAEEASRERAWVRDILTDIQREVRDTNGRLRKAEANISGLQSNQSDMIAKEVARALVGDGSVPIVGPDGALTVPVTPQIRLSKTQKAGIGALLTACAPSLIDAIRQGIELLTMVFRHGAGQ